MQRLSLRKFFTDLYPPGSLNPEYVSQQVERLYRYLDDIKLNETWMMAAWELDIIGSEVNLLEQKEEDLPPELEARYNQLGSLIPAEQVDEVDSQLFEIHNIFYGKGDLILVPSYLKGSIQVGPVIFPYAERPFQIKKDKEGEIEILSGQLLRAYFADRAERVLLPWEQAGVRIPSSAAEHISSFLGPREGW